MSAPRATGSAPGAAAAQRAVPYHCPFCAEEDLRPHGPTPGAWHCRACLRTFSVQFHGIEPLVDTSTGDRP
jgi:ribosomal protein L37AE/L43A